MSKYYKKQKESERIHSAHSAELQIHICRNTLTSLLEALPENEKLVYRTISEKLRGVGLDIPIIYKGWSFVKCRAF